MWNLLDYKILTSRTRAGFPCLLSLCYFPHAIAFTLVKNQMLGGEIHIKKKMMLFKILFIYFERESERAWGRGREREREREPQADSALSAQSPMQLTNGEITT